MRKKPITACIECHRRKQKCNRSRPCNFCSVRGVPELCRYGVGQHYPSSTKDHFSPTSDTWKNTSPSTVHTPPIDLLDQIGYSQASRHAELEDVGEYTSSPGLAFSRTGRSISTSDKDTYQMLVSRLPSEQIRHVLIDAYFSINNWSFPVLDEHHFRNLYKNFQSNFLVESSYSIDGYLPASLISFPALLFGVLAVTLQFTVPNSTEARALDLSTTQQCINLSHWYMGTGRQIAHLFEQEKPTTTVIEFHLLRMTWMKNSGCGREGWQCLNMALRQAQEIDLHRLEDVPTTSFGADTEQTLSMLWELEHRRRLWARIFIFDSHMAVALGRPRGINREDCNTSPPLDCEYPCEPSRTPLTSTNHNQQPPNAFSGTMFSIALSHKYHDLMSMRAAKLDLRDYDNVTRLHNDVEALLTDLPPALRPSFPLTTWDSQMSHLPLARQRLLTTTNIFLLALHRPLISTHTASRTAAIDAALTIAQSQQELFKVVPQAQHKLYGFSFYTIDAGIFLTAITLKYPTMDMEKNQEVLQALRNSCARLSCMADRSHIAKTGAQVLRRCCDLIEATAPLRVGTVSDNGISEPSQTIDAIDFFQRFGLQMPDQATRELIAQLERGSTTISSPATGLVPALSEVNQQNAALLVLGPLPSDESVFTDFTDFTADDMIAWQF